jgi:hemerythrin-like domain-containing protein
MPNSKPIKRHHALIRFSREHHQGLLLVWKIRTGLKSQIDTDRIIRYVRFFFENDLLNHFRDEERLLFSYFDKNDILIKKAWAEHEEIYRFISELQTGKNQVELLQKLASSLEAHIRFEERELFNFMQSNMPEKKLLELIEQHANITTDTCLNWPDEFWKTTPPNAEPI